MVRSRRFAALAIAVAHLAVTGCVGVVNGSDIDAGSGGDLAGSGGAVGTGGAIATGGRGATGGTIGTGGRGTGGSVGTGGRSATGGTVGTGGRSGTGGRNGTGGAANADGGTATTFTEVYNSVIVVYCSGAACHNPGTQRGVGFSTKAAAYAYIRTQVTPGDPVNSYIRFIIVTTPRFMPPPANPGPNAQELALLESWISAGALNN